MFLKILFNYGAMRRPLLYTCTSNVRWDMDFKVSVLRRPLSPSVNTLIARFARFNKYYINTMFYSYYHINILHKNIYLFVYLFICLFVYLFICLFVYLFIYLFIYLFN